MNAGGIRHYFLLHQWPFSIRTSFIGWEGREDLPSPGGAVRLYVRTQVVAPHEGRAADVTLVLPDAGVQLHVPLQTLLVLEELAAEIAQQGLRERRRRLVILVLIMNELPRALKIHHF